MGNKKAQQSWNEAEPQFAQRVSFDEAFPIVETVDLEVTETNHGYPIGQATRRTKLTFQKFVDCTNPSCKDGGIDVARILGEMVNERKTNSPIDQKCQGQEKVSRQSYRSCMHGFIGELTVTYKEPIPAEAEIVPEDA
jgi:hypothetical protein